MLNLIAVCLWWCTTISIFGEWFRPLCVQGETSVLRRWTASTIQVMWSLIRNMTDCWRVSAAFPDTSKRFNCVKHCYLGIRLLCLHRSWLIHCRCLPAKSEFWIAWHSIIVQRHAIWDEAFCCQAATWNGARWHHVQGKTLCYVPISSGKRSWRGQPDCSFLLCQPNSALKAWQEMDPHSKYVRAARALNSVALLSTGKIHFRGDDAVSRANSVKSILRLEQFLSMSRIDT